jgi:molybdopterin converting factor small subunit
MVRVTVELWLWFGKELGDDFESPSDMRSVLETAVEAGTSVRELFEKLAEEYGHVRDRVFTGPGFAPHVVATLNERVINASELLDRVLEEGDKVTVLPIYAGG